MSNSLPTSHALVLPRAVAFVDAQNLFHDAERLFGYDFPNFNITKLCNAISTKKGWSVAEIRYYTGVPSEIQNRRYKLFWDKKIYEMKREGVTVIRRALKDREVSIRLYKGITVHPLIDSASAVVAAVPSDHPWTTDRGRLIREGTVIEQKVFTEKGIDVSIAVDSIRYAIEDRFEVCLFFSQDSDLDPAVKEIKEVAKSNGRSYHLASAFPSTGSGFGIPGTEAIQIDKSTYDSCIDPRDFFPKRS
jgi:uncharacterized LabA/DUF88 family protein